jgi:hypothetical protein
MAMDRGASQGRHISLGHDPYFKWLADEIGAYGYRQWYAAGITRRSVAGHFGRAFHQAVARAERIHFALDGIRDIEEAVRLGTRGFMRGDPARGIPGNMTNAELHYIKTHPEILAKTLFYREGQSVPNPFSM